MKHQVVRGDWISKLLGFKRSFLRDVSGSVLSFVAVGLPVFVGVVGVGIDLSNWYAVRRQVQGIADARRSARSTPAWKTASA